MGAIDAASEVMVDGSARVAIVERGVDGLRQVHGEVLERLKETHHVALTARNGALAAREAETKAERKLAKTREE